MSLSRKRGPPLAAVRVHLREPCGACVVPDGPGGRPGGGMHELREPDARDGGGSREVGARSGWRDAGCVRTGTEAEMSSKRIHSMRGPLPSVLNISHFQEKCHILKVQTLQMKKPEDCIPPGQASPWLIACPGAHGTAPELLPGVRAEGCHRLNTACCARDTAPAPAQALPSHGVVRWRGRPSPASGCRVSRRDKGRPVWPAAGCPAEGLEEQEHGVLRMARRRLGRGRRALLRESRGILRESVYQSHVYRRRDAVAVVLVLPEARRSCQKDPHPSDIGLPLSSPCWCHTGCTCRI